MLLHPAWGKTHPDTRKNTPDTLTLKLFCCLAHNGSIGNNKGYFLHPLLRLGWFPVLLPCHAPFARQGFSPECCRGHSPTRGTCRALPSFVTTDKCLKLVICIYFCSLCPTAARAGSTARLLEELPRGEEAGIHTNPEGKKPQEYPA